MPLFPDHRQRGHGLRQLRYSLGVGTSSPEHRVGGVLFKGSAQTATISWSRTDSTSSMTILGGVIVRNSSNVIGSALTHNSSGSSGSYFELEASASGSLTVGVNGLLQSVYVNQSTSGDRIITRGRDRRWQSETPRVRHGDLPRTTGSSRVVNWVVTEGSGTSRSPWGDAERHGTSTTFSETRNHVQTEDAGILQSVWG